MNAEQFATAQLCDDIRFEIGNKVSLMGIYGGDVSMAHFPITIPKLCCVVTFVTPITKPPKRVTAKIVLGEAVIAEQTAGDQDLQMLAKAALDVSKKTPERSFIMKFHFAISPFSVQEPSEMVVIVDSDDVEWTAAKFKIGIGPAISFGMSAST